MSPGTSAWRERARRTAGGGIVATRALRAMEKQDHRRRFTDPDGCRDFQVRSHKEGPVERVEVSTKVAGIDVAKSKLDVARHGSSQAVGFTNDAEGFERLGSWLAAEG